MVARGYSPEIEKKPKKVKHIEEIKARFETEHKYRMLEDAKIEYLSKSRALL